VVELAERYEKTAGQGSFHVVQVNEQAIMDSMIQANRHGHIACTQGGESLAGLKVALDQGIVGKDQFAVLDATAHHLKFIGFQQMYFEDSFPAEMGVLPKKELQNYPQEAAPAGLDRLPAPGYPLQGEEFQAFVSETAELIAKELGLKVR
jgi:threonine synthase